MARFCSVFGLFCCCFSVVHFTYVNAATLPQDWRSRIDPSVLESREAESGLCNLEEELELSEGNSFLLSVSTGKLLPQNYWPNGGKNIPYRIANGFEETARHKILRGMAAISRATVGCITFLPRTSQKDYIFFLPSDRSCQSAIGRRFHGGRQDIKLTRACANSTGTIQHEILHALGLYHEQNRPDRDQYVEIFFDNIKPDFVQNFRVFPDMEVYSTQYDFDSVMHYGAMDFAKYSNQPTIIPKTDKQTQMGQRRSLSILDVAKLQKAYGCQFDPENEEGVEAVTSTASTRPTIPVTTTTERQTPPRQTPPRQSPPRQSTPSRYTPRQSPYSPAQQPPPQHQQQQQQQQQGQLQHYQQIPYQSSQFSYQNEPYYQNRQMQQQPVQTLQQVQQRPSLP